MTLEARLAEQAQQLGDRVYLESIDPPARLTFAELDAACHQVAQLLARRGVGPGDRVSILSDNGPAFVTLFLGIQRAGAAANPINIEVNAKNAGQILGDVAPRLVFRHQTVPAELAAAAADTGVETLVFDDEDLFDLLAPYPAAPLDGPHHRPADIAVIDYTSGTTARPKGVCISGSAFAVMGRAPAARFDFTPRDRVLEYRSLAWASPQLLGLAATLHAGATLILARKFSQHRFFDWLRSHAVTIAAGVPAVINMLLDRPVAVTARDVPALRFITSSAAPLALQRQRDFEQRYGIPIVQGCGMTEAGFMAGNPPAATRAGSIGLPMPDLQARFVDDAGRTCPPGQEGELVVSGPQMASAYLAEGGRLEPIPGDGFPTGDLGYADDDGYLYLTGRKKDLIIRGGVNIAPLEITSALLAHPAVADAATIGVSDEVYGEAIACFVVPRPGQSLTAAEVLEHCRQRLSPFKRPGRVLVVEAIPKTARGKLAADQLRELWRRTGAAAFTA